MTKPWEMGLTAAVADGTDGADKPWNQGLQAAEVPQAGIKAKDIGVALKKGVEGIPGSLAGLADSVIGATTGLNRPVGRLSDFLGDVTGFQPGKWAKEAEADHSPEFKAQKGELNNAWESSGANSLSKLLLSPGEWDKVPEAWQGLKGQDLASSIARNPGAAVGAAVESLPGMVVGGGIGKGVGMAAKLLAPGAKAGSLLGTLAGDSALGAAARAGIGEGAITAGQSMANIDPSVDAQTAGLSSLGAGAVTGLIGGASGRLATKLGLPDLEMAMAGGAKGLTPLGLARRLPAGMVQEGLLEELPQSMQEQVWQNSAEGKPLGEGVLRQGVEGAMAGMVTAGAFNALPRKAPKAAAPGVVPANEELNAANRAAGAEIGNYDSQVTPPNAGLLENLAMQMPAPAPGSLAEAAAQAPGGPAAAADPLSNVLQAYATREAAQAALDARSDAPYMSVVPHPRGDSGFAVVQKSPGEVARLQLQEQADAASAALKDSANQEAQTRQDQLASEEEAAQRGAKALKTRTELHRGAAALEKSITDSTPPADVANIKAQAAELRAQAQTLADEAKAEQAARLAEKAKALTQAPAGAVQAASVAQTEEAAQAELAPVVAQPVKSMPGVQAAAQAKVSAANEAAQTRQDQLASEETATVDEGAATANTAPTDAQKDAGNYAKGHITVGGLNIAVENPAGSSRSGTEGGKAWKTKMKAHYGYVKRTMGADGDQVDVYVKPGTTAGHEGPVFVVDQYNPKTGEFDEHKTLIGYGNAAEAAKAYDAHFGDKSGPTRRGAVTQMTMPGFKTWLKNGDTTAPASSTKFGGQAADAGQAAQDEIVESGGRFSPKRGTEPAKAATKAPKSETVDERLVRKAAESNERKRAVTGQGKPTLRTSAQDAETINKAAGVSDAEVVREMSGANQAAAGEISKQQADFISNIARLFKKRVVFFKSATLKADGMWNQGDTIYLNSTSSVMQLRVLGHELTHAMRVQAPEAYARMTAALAGLLTDAQLAAQHLDYFSKELADLAALDAPADGTGDQTLREFLAEEWMADLAGNRFAESGFWNSLFAEIESQHGNAAAKGIIARMRMAINNAINKLLQVVKGGKFAVDSRVADNLEQVRAAVKDGFVAYEKAAKAGLLKRGEGATAKFVAKSEQGVPAKNPVVESAEQDTQQASARVMFEVAPDPNDEVLSAAWNALPDTRKFDVSQAVAEALMPQVFRAAGVKAQMVPQLGGYLDSTNPSFAAIVRSGTEGQRLIDVAKLGGFALAQDSMMVLSATPFDGSEPTGVITVVMPEGATGMQAVHRLYEALRAVAPDAIQGHTTVGREMMLAVPTARLDALHTAVVQVLQTTEGDFQTRYDVGHLAFPEKKDYDYGSDRIEEGAPELLAGREDARRLRAEANRLLARELGGSARLSTERGYVGTEDRSNAAGPARPVHDRAGQEGRIDLTGVHFSNEGRETLRGVFFGRGIKSEEAKRVFEAQDLRLHSRIYAYINEGQGVFPETGVGAYAHKVQLDNLYDLAADKLGIRAKHPMRTPADANTRESAILDAGFDGYYVRAAFGKQGVAILLGMAARKGIAAEYKGTQYRGIDTAAPAVATLSPEKQAVKSLMADKALPGGAVPGATWGRLIKGSYPTLHASLEPSGVFENPTPMYRDELIKTGGVKLSVQRAEVERIFEGLDSRGLKLARAEDALASHPQAAAIRRVQENILDILDALEGSGIVKINC